MRAIFCFIYLLSNQFVDDDYSEISSPIPEEETIQIETLNADVKIIDYFSLLSDKKLVYFYVYKLE